MDETGETYPYNIQIKKIDAIFNPEYEKIMQSGFYRIPIFFKSLPKRNMRYWDKGYIDNGRKQVKLTT